MVTNGNSLMKANGTLFYEAMTCSVWFIHLLEHWSHRYDTLDLILRYSDYSEFNKKRILISFIIKSISDFKKLPKKESFMPEISSTLFSFNESGTLSWLRWVAEKMEH